MGLLHFRRLLLNYRPGREDVLVSSCHLMRKWWVEYCVWWAGSRFDQWTIERGDLWHENYWKLTDGCWWEFRPATGITKLEDVFVGKLKVRFTIALMFPPVWCHGFPMDFWRWGWRYLKISEDIWADAPVLSPKCLIHFSIYTALFLIKLLHMYASLNIGFWF